ncbi:hypothetical protein SAMN06265784_12013 [Paraburkholderia susongensis]|uniref:Uncharacterized protein n=1 Tax=Paraburkholderia susongensis TaxID=1515439 RepID=A0A1X7M6W1_9BURK|nr:hypothetical protein SAMN06265784_12013 [Paraburkholderia susongensis]
MTQEQQVTRAKVGMLELALELLAYVRSVSSTGSSNRSWRGILRQPGASRLDSLEFARKTLIPH